MKITNNIRRKTRKIAVITSGVFYILSLVTLALCVIFAIWPSFLGYDPSVYSDIHTFWASFGRKLVLIGLADLQIFIASWIVLHKSRAKKLKRLPAYYKNKSRNAFKKAAELSNVDEVANMLQEIDEKGTQVDVVLNNAGLQIAYRVEYLKTPVSDFVDSFQINTITPAMICYHFLPGMIKRGFGRIVNTSSGINLEAEQAVIGGILVDPQCVGMISEILPSGDMFYNTAYGAIYESILELEKQNNEIN